MALINFKIYIFNTNGTLLYNSPSKFTDDSNIKYYSLIPINTIDNYYYYVIGYLNNNNYLYLLLYKYDISNKKSLFFDSMYEQIFKMKDYEDYTFRFENKGLSCEYMSEYNKAFPILACFFIYSYNNKEYFSVGYYRVQNIGISKTNDISSDYKSVQNPKFIKSERTIRTYRLSNIRS